MFSTILLQDQFSQDMDIILRTTDYSFIFFIFIISIYYVYCFYLVVYSYTNNKILHAPQIFDIKAAKNVDTATINIFQINFQTFSF